MTKNKSTVWPAYDNVVMTEKEYHFCAFCAQHKSLINNKVIMWFVVDNHDGASHVHHGLNAFKGDNLHVLITYECLSVYFTIWNVNMMKSWTICSYNEYITCHKIAHMNECAHTHTHSNIIQVHIYLIWQGILMRLHHVAIKTHINW